MPIKTGRCYRSMADFSLVPQEESRAQFQVRGTAVVFDCPTCLFERDGIQFFEVIDRHAFDGCDLSDVIFNYNHGGKVVARLRNKTLRLNRDENGLHVEADLSGTVAGKELYEEIDGGYIDRMSFSFAVAEESYNRETRTNTITKIKKLYDVSAVDIPAYQEATISARSFFEGEYLREFADLEQSARRRKLIARTRTYTQI